MSYNPYTTARLIQAIEGVNPADSFLRDRYFPTNGAADIFNSAKVLTEYKDGDLRLAPVVFERQGGITLTRTGVQMREYEPPCIAPKRPLSTDEINKRGFGEAIYGDKSPAERAQILVTADLAELDNAITRREEMMAAQTLLNNACVLKAYGDDADDSESFEVQFYEGNSNPAAYAVTNAWDSANADIIGDLSNMASMLTRKGLPATDYVCAPDVADAIINDEKIQKLLDNRRIDFGESVPKLEAPGAAVVCVLNIRGRLTNIISYDQVYTADDGTIQQYIPSGCGVMTAPGAGHMLYGAVTQIEQLDGEFHTYAKSRVPKYVSDASANVRELTVTARPIPVPYNCNPFISSKNLLS